MPLFLDAIIPLDPRLMLAVSPSGPQDRAAKTPASLAQTCAGLAADIIAVPRRPHASPQMRERPARPYNRFVERMLADPLIRLVMDADGVSEAEIRSLYGNVTSTAGQSPAASFQYQASTCVPLPQTGPRPGSPRPHIGE